MLTSTAVCLAEMIVCYQLQLSLNTHRFNLLKNWWSGVERLQEHKAVSRVLLQVLKFLMISLTAMKTKKEQGEGVSI